MRIRVNPYILVLAALVGLLALGSCGGSNNAAKGNFTMAFTGFDPHVGQTFYLKVVDTAGNVTVGTSTPSTVASANFNVSIPSIIESGHNYQIDYWADVDGNGTLDHSPIGTPAGVDHSWRKTGTGTANGLSLTFAHDTNWTDITPF